MSERMSDFEDRDPKDWPHTPSLEIFLALEKRDPNLRWRAGMGHMDNLLDEAIERLERVGLL